jgi:hypothetical protein
MLPEPSATCEMTTEAPEMIPEDRVKSEISIIFSVVACRSHPSTKKIPKNERKIVRHPQAMLCEAGSVFFTMHGLGMPYDFSLIFRNFVKKPSFFDRNVFFSTI